MSHERAVAAFMKEVRDKDPDRFKDVCKEFPVMSEDQLRLVRRRSLPLSVIDPPEEEDEW